MHINNEQTTEDAIPQPEEIHLPESEEISKPKLAEIPEPKAEEIQQVKEEKAILKNQNSNDIDVKETILNRETADLEAEERIASDMSEQTLTLEQRLAERRKGTAAHSVTPPTEPEDSGFKEIFNVLDELDSFVQAVPETEKALPDNELEIIAETTELAQTEVNSDQESDLAYQEEKAAYIKQYLAEKTMAINEIKAKYTPRLKELKANPSELNNTLSASIKTERDQELS